MKPKALPILVVLLPAVLCLGRASSNDDSTHAINGVLRLQESMRDPDSLQVSSAIVTNKGVCIEYRRKNGGIGSGFAVYKIDKDVIWVDNSWLWDQVCVAGKYGQRRDGKDVTDAVNAAIEAKRAASPTVQLVVPAARVETMVLPAKEQAARGARLSVAPVQAVRAAPVAGSVGTSTTARGPVAVVTPARVARPTAATAPAVSQANTLAQPKLPAVAAQASVPSASSYAVSSPPVASEHGTIRGVTIVDNGGALDRKGPPPPPESLGDAARRLRQSKQK
jgi:hypothetical protein